jgi:hypothetical protein
VSFSPPWSVQVAPYKGLFQSISAILILTFPHDKPNSQIPNSQRVEGVASPAFGVRYWSLSHLWVRISAIVDACFKLIVDGVSAPSWTRRDARKRGRNVSQASANTPASGVREALVFDF